MSLLSPADGSKAVHTDTSEPSRPGAARWHLRYNSTTGLLHLTREGAGYGAPRVFGWYSDAIAVLRAEGADISERPNGNTSDPDGEIFTAVPVSA